MRHYGTNQDERFHLTGKKQKYYASDFLLCSIKVQRSTCCDRETLEGSFSKLQIAVPCSYRPEMKSKVI